VTSSGLCYTAYRLNKNDVLLGMDFRTAELIEKHKEIK